MCVWAHNFIFLCTFPVCTPPSAERFCERKTIILFCDRNRCFDALMRHWTHNKIVCHIRLQCDATVVQLSVHLVTSSDISDFNVKVYLLGHEKSPQKPRHKFQYLRERTVCSFRYVFLISYIRIHSTLYSSLGA